MDVFAPGRKDCTAFVVRNISPQNKTINIFNYPIPMYKTRDLLAIRGVAEDDIRASILKGEIRHKFKCEDIELVYSDIDLLQFSECEKEWLISLGFTTGIDIGWNQLDGYVQGLIELGAEGGGGGAADGYITYLWREKIQLIGLRNGSNRTFYTPDKFINGIWYNNHFVITIEHNGKQLYENVDFTIAESGGPGTGYDTINIFSFTPNTHSILYATYVIRA
jgi:hypothetical protein